MWKIQVQREIVTGKNLGRWEALSQGVTFKLRSEEGGIWAEAL